MEVASSSIVSQNGDIDECGLGNSKYGDTLSGFVIPTMSAAKRRNPLWRALRKSRFLAPKKRALRNDNLFSGV
jgi:hypothetical protein